tara:strand:+ start:38 stop:520 length:483 start_codon:yes stop_codon:yes gene_type:complete
MKNILFTLALLVSFSSFGQKFNGYNHIAVPDVEYKDGSMDKYEMIPRIIKFFKKQGFNTLRVDDDGNIYDGEINTESPCEILRLALDHTAPTYVQGYIAVDMTFRFYDCNDVEVMKFSSSYGANTAKKAIKKGVKKILEIIESRIGKYKFDPRKTPSQNK